MIFKKQKRKKIVRTTGTSSLRREATFTKQEEELRTQKIKKLKEQIEQGTYQVEAAEVAKKIVRSEVARLLGSKRH